MKKTIIVSLFVVSFCTLLYFTPYIAIYNMKKAIEKNNPDVLSDYIDYTSLKDSLKRSFASNLVNTDSGSNLFGLIGTTIATSLISAMMDNIISPEGMAVLLKGKSPVSTIDSNPNNSPQNNKKPIMRYGSHNRFEMLFRVSFRLACVI